MRTLFITALLFTCLACESQPSREGAGSPPSGKATREAAPVNSIELQAKVEAGPADLESRVVTNGAVLNCLRQGIDPADPAFYVGMAGRISNAGALGMPLVTGGNPVLNLCLVGALKDLSFSQGQAGSFRLVIRRASGRGGNGNGKSFNLDLDGLKKFE